MFEFNLFLLAGLLVLQLLDGYSTVVALRQGNKEKNPLLIWLMAKIGVIPALAITKIICFGFYVYVGYGQTDWEFSAVSIVIAIIYTKVVYSNFKLLK